MKLCLLILVCCLLVGLLLSLTQAVGLNYLLPVVGSGRWFDQETGPASDASTVSFIRSMEFHPARAGLESLVFDCALTADNIGPPGQETYGRPGTDGALESCRSSRQLKSTPSNPFSAKLLAQPTEFEQSGFCNSL
jgi:hypothetical protein